MATEFGPVWPLFWFSSSKLNNFFLSLSCKQSDKGTAKLPVVNKVSNRALCVFRWELSVLYLVWCRGIYFIVLSLCTRAVRMKSPPAARRIFAVQFIALARACRWVEWWLFYFAIPRTATRAALEMFYFCALTQIFRFYGFRLMPHTALWIWITSRFIADRHEELYCMAS